MLYDFLVETYASERLKTLNVWSMFRDDDLSVRPHPRLDRDRTPGEHMVHQCMSEDKWFVTMFGIDVGAPPLPAGETRLEFIRRYAEDSERRLAALRAKNEALARSNEMLSAAQHAAARAQRLSAIGQFAATVAHKIGTPLTALSGHVQLLMEDLSLPSKVRGRLQTVEAQIERTSRIIQDLLLYPRRAPPVRTKIDINDCLRECAALFRTECERQHVSCITELSADLPLVEADRQHMQEAFNHLIENALQAMPHGGSL